MTTVKNDPQVRTVDPASTDANTGAAPATSSTGRSTPATGAPAPAPLDTSKSFFEFTDPGVQLALPSTAAVLTWSPTVSLVAPTFNYAAGLLGNMSLFGAANASPLAARFYAGTNWGRAKQVAPDTDDTWRSLVADHYGAIWKQRGKTLTPAETTLLAEVVANFNRLSTLDGVSERVALPDIKDIDVALRDIEGTLAHRPAHLATAKDATTHASVPTAGQSYEPGWNDNLRSVVLFTYKDMFKGLNAEQADRRLQILMLLVAQQNEIRDVSLSGSGSVKLPSVERVAQQVADLESSSEFNSAMAADDRELVTHVRATGTGALASLSRFEGRDAVHGTSRAELDAAVAALRSDVTTLRWDRAFSMPGSFNFFGFGSGFFSEFADDPSYDRAHLPPRDAAQSDEDYIRTNWPTTDEAVIQLAVRDPRTYRRLLLEKVGGYGHVLKQSGELARTLGIDVTDVRARYTGTSLDDNLNQQIVAALHNAGIQVEYNAGDSFESVMRQLKDHPQAELLEHLRTVRALAYNEACRTPGLSDDVQGPPTFDVVLNGAEAMHDEGLINADDYQSVMEVIEKEFGMPDAVRVRLEANPELAGPYLYALIAGGKDLDVNDPAEMRMAIRRGRGHLFLKRELLAGLGIDIEAITTPPPRTTEELDRRLIQALVGAGFDVQVHPGDSFTDVLAQLKNHPRYAALRHLAVERMFARLQITDPDAFARLAQIDSTELDRDLSDAAMDEVLELITAELSAKPARAKVDALALAMSESQAPTVAPEMAEASAPVRLERETSDPGGMISGRRVAREQDQELQQLESVADSRTYRTAVDDVERDRQNKGVDEKVRTIAENEQREQSDPAKRRGGPLSKG